MWRPPDFVKHPPPPVAILPLAGRAAVVTGGGRGAGAAIARRLAADGARLVIAARTRDEIEQVAAEVRASGAVESAVVCDVTDPASIEHLAHSARRLFERIDILINNAGVARTTEAS